MNIDFIIKRKIYVKNCIIMKFNFAIALLQDTY